MDNFNLIENFITPAEQQEIIAWALTKKGQCVDRQNLHGGGTGKRFSQNVHRLEPFPNIIRELGRRMEATLGMHPGNRMKYKLVIHEQGADTADHVDDYSSRYPDFFRAAILVQSATVGGIFQVNSVPITFPELSLLQFLGASEHGVTRVDSGERILLRANWFRLHASNTRSRKP